MGRTQTSPLIRIARRSLLIVAWISALPAWSASTPTAADIVPADCAFFSTSLHLKRQLDAVVQSRAARRLRELSFVKTQWERLKRTPEFQQIADVLETPLAKDALDVAKDAMSQEIFIYGGKGWSELLGLLLEFQQQNIMATINAAVTREQPNPIPALVNTVLAHKDLRIAPLVVGFKVSDKSRVDGLLEKLEATINGTGMPVKAARRQIGGGRFLTLELSAETAAIPRENFIQDVSQQRVPVDQAERLYDWLTGQTLAVALGYKGDYLLFSIAADNAHLAALGAGPVLGNAPVLEPARKHMTRPDFVALSYASLELQSLNEFDVDELSRFLKTLLGQVQPFLPSGMHDRLVKDLPVLLRDLSAGLPKPSEYVEVTLLNRGLERFGYSRSPVPGIEYSKPLAVLRHAGAEPLFAFAYGTTSSKAEYETAIGWLKRIYGYWSDFGVPLLTPEQREQYQRMAAIVLPLLDSLERTTRTKLLPATDAGQLLIVIDTELEIQPVFQPPVAFPKPMPMFEPAIVCTLNDRQLFLEAVSEYVRAIESAAPELAKLFGGQLPEPFRIPRATETPFGEDAAMYSYGVITGAASLVSPDLVPHAVVTKDRLVLSASAKMTRRLLTPTDERPGSVVSWTAPSGSALIIRPAGLWKAAREWLDYAAQIPGSPLAGSDPQSRQMIKEHIDVVIEVLGAYKGTTSRSFRDGPYVVRHTWSEFQDLP
jgi:hypothetical protein